MSKAIPNGVYPTMITPFTKDNKIDYNAVEALINWYAEKGVDGIFAICQSSEIFFLSFEERLELLRFVMKHTPKNIAVVASGHVADDLDTQIAEAKAFVDEGIDSYVFISNRFAREDEDDSVFLKNIDRAVDAMGDMNFGIYECPYPYKRIMTPDVLKKLAESGRFTFLKDTCCDPAMIGDKLKAVEGMGLKIFNAIPQACLKLSKWDVPVSRVLWQISTPRYIRGCVKISIKSLKRQRKYRRSSVLLRLPSASFIPSMQSIISPSRVCRLSISAAPRMRQVLL